MTTNRRITLARIPTGLPDPEDFALVAAPATAPADGEVLLRSIYLSMDPYQRSWMAGGANYGATATLGATVIGRAVSEVVESRDARFATGDFVYGESGWQTYPVVRADALQKIDRSLGPISTAIGVLGSPGLTAWVGMTDIGTPRPGETVVVSAATGAVGSIAGQIAQMRGARVVGVAGAPEKCRYAVETLGYATCVSHRSDDLRGELARACPSGIDVYFDNTGGAVTDAVYRLLRPGARVALCGLVAEYGDASARGPSLRYVLANQALVRGFSVRQNLHRMAEYRREATAWLAAGRLRYREDIAQGIENAPAAFRAMLAGQNLGKQLVQVGVDPTRA
jgi:NADPH-dependent curcumin reductase